MLEGVDTYLVNLGFGVDYHHEVCGVYVLEAVADLTKTGDYLGSFSLQKGMPEFDTFCDVVEYSCLKSPDRSSIVATSILSAGQGEFGDYHFTERTAGKELFINPLMSDPLLRSCLVRSRALHRRVRRPRPCRAPRLFPRGFRPVPRSVRHR